MLLRGSKQGWLSSKVLPPHCHHYWESEMAVPLVPLEEEEMVWEKGVWEG